MFPKTFAIVCFATLLTYVYSDDDDLLTLNCYSCLSFDQQPTTASCSYMNCTDLPAGGDYDFGGRYAVCVKTKTQFEDKIIYQASCELQVSLEDYKFCEDLEYSDMDVPSMKLLECASCRGDLCNSY